MDSDYQDQRDKFNNQKASHAVEGVGMGLASLATGVGKGLTGIFTKPVEGAQKQGKNPHFYSIFHFIFNTLLGVGGFFKGVGKGLMGAVFKPVTGVMDLASKTAEGIKNTTTYFDEKKDIDIRTRFPRCFYGKERTVKQYSQRDAEICAFFQEFKSVICPFFFNFLPILLYFYSFLWI